MCRKSVKYIVFFIFMTVSVLYAQDYPGGYDPNAENSGDKVKKIAPYFLIDLKFPKFPDKWATELGGGAGILFKKTFALSVEYYSLLSNNIRVQVDNERDYVLGLGYGGLSAAYTLFPLDFIMLSAGAFGGLGRATNSYQNVLGVSNYSVDDWFFTGDLRAKLGVKIFMGLWIGATAGYRFASGLNYYNIGNKDLTGLYLSVGLFTF